MAERFATTQWSVVHAARGGTETEARRALESLCEAYWFPLYAFVRRRGHPPDEAADLTQAFFADLLSRSFLDGIDSSKGRFRSFLLASLEHFLSHEREKAAALKRGGAAQIFPLDAVGAENRYSHEPADRLTPEVLFERRRLKPCLTGGDHAHYREIAVALGTTENAVKAAVHRLRQEYGRALRQEIAHTVADPAEVDDEVRHLLAVVRPWQDV
jgi:RNA polymerase sigma-70 factor (ECF subfamily)